MVFVLYLNDFFGIRKVFMYGFNFVLFGKFLIFKCEVYNYKE